MAANGISTLANKELRQIAKLDLAKINRTSSGRRDTYDRDLLPSKYSGNNVVDNAADLVPGRPWT